MPSREERNHWLTLDDAALLAACRVDAYRASGPGGQHRNKVSSAVRLRHEPTAVVVIAEEERSQHANKARALKRLRMAIALLVRTPFTGPSDLPAVLREHITPAGRLEISKRNPAFPLVVATVLDVLAAQAGRLREAAAVLGVTTGQLSRFVTDEGKMLEAVNRLRQTASLRPLSASK